MRFCLDDGTPLRHLRDTDATLVIPESKPFRTATPNLPPTNKRRPRNLLYFFLFIIASFVVIFLVTRYTGSWPYSPIVSSPTPTTSSASSEPSKPLLYGVWIGQSRTVDRGVVRNASITVDFDRRITSDGECPENGGRIISVDSDTITVEWGQCGREVVKYSIRGGVLSAEGATVDIAGNRSNKRTWTLTQQRA